MRIILRVARSIFRCRLCAVTVSTVFGNHDASERGIFERECARERVSRTTRTWIGEIHKLCVEAFSTYRSLLRFVL